jgi:DNA polymerase-3 subunit alpha
MSQYTELHLHDYYSTLDGLNSPAEYFARCKELGMTHLAQTNHGTLSGHREFQKAAKEASVIPILGVEAYISPTDRFDRRSKAKRSDGTSVYNHIILLAQNERGLASLNRLNQLAWEEGFYNKPRIDLDLLEDHNAGLIVLSGCMNGLIAKAIEREDMDEAMRVAHRLKTMLPGRFYIEYQTHNPENISNGLVLVADTLGIPLVVTSDCHYARKEDLWIEEAMLILSTNPKVNFEADLKKSQKMDMLERFNYLYPNRTMSFEEIEIYLHSAQEQRAALGGLREDMLANTMEIANSIGEYPFNEALDLLPRPKNAHPDELLEKKAWAGLKKRGLDKDPTACARLREELDIIKAKDFSTYFLVEGDMITWARNEKIMVGPGRGSAAGSLVCYALGITMVNPLKYGLLFFRFLDPSRDDYPDIDTDFEDRRRGEVKEYLRRKFKHVASIATYNKFQGKGVVRDAARVFRIPVAEVNKALKGVEAPPDKPEIFFDLFENSDGGKEFIRKYPEVMKLAGELTGRIRGTGMHAAGVVIAKENISKYAPIETAKDPNDPLGIRVPLVAMDMKDCADLGLIKLDILGLKALSIISDVLTFIGMTEEQLYEIPLDDKKVYEMLSEGYTRGVFQCEAAPYTTLILKMGGVWSFEELAASNALVRPGAMNTIGAEYIARKNGKTMITYPHEKMKSFTEETYGEILYQEQVMLTMTEIAGMSMSTANKVRSIIGKKKDVSEFEPYRVEFVEGATPVIGEKMAEKLWNDFLAHAGYSFNKSHAIVYSLVSYWTAWLKLNYPREFMCAALRNEGDKDTRTDYLIEAKRLGLKVMLPHVEASELQFSLAEGGIRFGLENIKFISTAGGTKLIENRPYNTYAVLEEKVMEKGSGMTSRILSALNAVGAAAYTDNPRKGDERENFYEYLSIPAFEQMELPPKVMLQFRSLDEYEEKGVFSIMAMARKIKRGDGWSRIEVVDETGTAGIFHSQDTLIETGQMYAMLVADNRIARYIPMNDISPRSKNTYCQFLYDTKLEDLTDNFYRVVAFQSHTTKAGKRMAYIVICDKDRNMQRVMAFPQEFMKAYTRCQEGSTVALELESTKDGDSMFIKNFL